MGRNSFHYTAKSGQSSRINQDGEDYCVNDRLIWPTSNGWSGVGDAGTPTDGGRWDVKWRIIFNCSELIGLISDEANEQRQLGWFSGKVLSEILDVMDKSFVCALISCENL